MIGLLIEGFTRGVLGENSADQPQAGGPAAPAAVLHGGAVLSPRPAPAQLRDAGPHGRADLRRRARSGLDAEGARGPAPRTRVPATFFLVGAHAASWPGLVREEVAAGDQVGSHTYTHANLGASGWREGLELTLTQNALAGAAGVRTRLLRTPFSSEPDALSAADWRAAGRRAATATWWSWRTLTPGTGPVRASAGSSPRRCRAATAAPSSCCTTAAVTAARRWPRCRSIITGCAPAVTGSRRSRRGLGAPGRGRGRDRQAAVRGRRPGLTQQAADHGVGLLAVLPGHRQRADRRSGCSCWWGSPPRTTAGSAGPRRPGRRPRGGRADGLAAGQPGPRPRRIGRDPGVQRGRGHRGDGTIDGRQRLSRPGRGDRGRRRLHRRHGRHRARLAAARGAA